MVHLGSDGCRTQQKSAPTQLVSCAPGHCCPAAEIRQVCCSASELREGKWCIKLASWGGGGAELWRRGDINIS
jgi:hypothetical protein